MCPHCAWLGRVPCQPTFAVRSGVAGLNDRGPIQQVSTGHPIPCPLCKGKKTMTVYVENGVTA